MLLKQLKRVIFTSGQESPKKDLRGVHLKGRGYGLLNLACGISGLQGIVRRHGTISRMSADLSFIVFMNQQVKSVRIFIIPFKYLDCLINQGSLFVFLGLFS